MIGIENLYVITISVELICVFIACRRSNRAYRDDLTWAGFVGLTVLFLISTALMTLMVACTNTHSDACRPLTIVLYVIMFIVWTIMTNYIVSIFGLYLIVFGMLFNDTTVSQTADGDYILYNPLSYFVTGAPLQQGMDYAESELVASRGRWHNEKSTRTIYSLRDKDGNVFIPGLCDYTDSIVRYDIKFYNGDPESVNVIYLTTHSGGVRVLDYFGRDTNAPGYTPPDYDDEIDTVIN